MKHFYNFFKFVVIGAICFAPSAIEAQNAIFSCPADIVVECGTDLNDFSIVGEPFVNPQFGNANVVLTHADDTLSFSACSMIIARVWNFSMFYDGQYSDNCTQTITVVDTQGPVFGDLEDITVQCLEYVPGFADVSAVDACSGPAAVSNWSSQTGELERDCDLSTAYGPGADWSVWLPVLASDGETSSANFVFDVNGGQFQQFVDGTAHMYGTLVNTANANEQFVVDLWFENKASWNTWSGLGRNYKNDLGLACATADYTNWNYYELVGGFSTFTGQGDLAGDVLYVYHMPSNYYFGFQIGIGANNKNCSNGMSGWFTYNGFVDGESVDGHGDVNVDVSCNDFPIELCVHNTAFTYFYRATDVCGHATIADQLITVNDTIAPEFNNCPQSENIECSDLIPAVAQGITATDNCVGEAYVTYLGETVDSTDLCAIVITRTWEARDNCNNRRSCVQTITIRDTTAPILHGTPEQEITVNCDAIPAMAEVTVTDNCDSTIVLTDTTTYAYGNCAGYYTIYHSWSAEDNCENSVDFVQTIHVQDTVGPVFDPYEFYAHIECNQIPALLTAQDNCSGATVTVIYEMINSGGCLGVYHRIYRATDGCGNTTDAEQYISILDTTAPELIGVPADTTVECSTVSILDNGNYFTDGGVYGEDNCGMEVTIAYSEEVVATDDDCPQSYDIIRTWVATDSCENSDLLSQTVHVVDTTAPVLTVPYTAYFSCHETIYFAPASAYDNCGSYTIDEDIDTLAGNCPNNYTIRRTFVATDECDNSSLPQYQDIVVTDTTPPSFNQDQQQEYTKECNTPYDAVQPVATDLCSDLITYSFVDTNFWGNSCENGFTRIWTATDECDNSSTFEQYYTIVDTTAPVVNPYNYEVDMLCDANLDEVMISAVDNCNGAIITFIDSLVSGSCAGRIVRTYTVRDGCYNYVVGQFPIQQFINLIDTVDPTIESETADFETQCGYAYEVAVPVFDDNCDDTLDVTSDTITQVINGCLTRVTYTWTAVDHCNNDVVSTTVVSIVDTMNPWFENFPADITVLCSESFPALVYPLAYDACDDNVEIEVSYDTMPGECPQEKFYYRYFRGFDNCGRQVVETQTIHVIDVAPPVFNQNQQQEYTEECNTLYAPVQPVATDLCSDLITYSFVDTNFWGNSCENGFTRIWTATDECDNSSTFEQYYTIVDTTAPVVNPYDYEVDMLCDANLDEVMISAVDNCNGAIITFIDSLVSGSCAGRIVRTYTVRDGCYNYVVGQFPIQQFINLIDTVDPTIESETADFEDECDDMVYPVYPPIFHDNCDDTLDIVEHLPVYNVINACVTEVTYSWTATDHCNNSITSSTVVTIRDTQAPVLYNTPEDENVDCIYAQYISVADVTAWDACSGDLMVSHTDTIEPGNCPMTYAIRRTFSATDECGFTATYVQHIYVSDTQAPYFTYVPEGGEYSCMYGAPDETATANDYCSTYTVYAADDTTFGDCPGRYSIERSFWAIDACNNASDTVEVTYTVVDNDAPEFGFVGNSGSESYQCVDWNTYVVKEVNATDYCGLDSIRHEIQDQQIDTCGNGTYRVYYTAVDLCGNESHLEYYIYVNDTQDPTFDNCPLNIVLGCNDAIPARPILTASDNCDDTVTIIADEDMIMGDLPAEGSIADCDLITPVRPAGNPCAYPYDWAMILLGMPSQHKYYSLSEGSLVQYPDGSVHLTATLNNVLAAGNGWFADVWFDGAMDWSEWSTQAFPTSFKADCGGEGINHEMWTYFLLQAGAGAELTGFGAYTGSSLNLTHTPTNQYFGFQLGDGANNYNGADNAFGGWFGYSGLFRSNQNADLSQVSGSGDFAFELDCCPDYYIVRQWTAYDCSGNSTSCSQTITFEGTTLPTDNPSAPVVSENETKEVSNVSASPNPATERTMFKFTAKNAAKTTLEVFDMTGSKVADVFMGVVESGIEYRVDYNVNNLATGVYTYRLTNGTQTDFGRLIISK